MGEANIWQPRVIGEVDGDFKSIVQRLSAVEGQTLFGLTEFVYYVGTGALKVYRDGRFLTPGIEFTETSEGSFTLTDPAIEGEIINAVGNVGVSGVTAEAALQAINDKITVSPVAPTVDDGVDGDIWFQVSI